MAVFKRQNICKPKGKFVGAYIPDELSSHVALYIVANDISKTEFLETVIEQKLSRVQHCTHALSMQIVEHLKSLKEQCTTEFKNKIAFELLQKGIDKDTVDKILRAYEKDSK